MLLSPRQLALAIGVSESSLKRWADAGKLAVSRTDGGHRRIAVSEAVRFIRDTGATVVRPDLLGLADRARDRRKSRQRTARVTAVSADSGFLSALLAGNSHAARASLVGRFLGGESIAALADGVLADAVAAIDTKGELASRVATDALLHALAAVRALCDVAADAPLAIGGARPGREVETMTREGAALRSAMGAAVLAGEGLRAIDLGAETSAAVLRAAVTAHEPTLTWIVDGEGIEIRAGDANAFRVRTLAELAAFARGLCARR